MAPVLKISRIVPCTKEPHGLARDDGKRPDGLTLVPWMSWRCVTWDVTAVGDTLGDAYLQKSAIFSLLESRRNTDH